MEGLASPELPAAPLLLISGQARLALLPKKHCLRWSSHLPNGWKKEKQLIGFLLNCTVKNNEVVKNNEFFLFNYHNERIVLQRSKAAF